MYIAFPAQKRNNRENTSTHKHTKTPPPPLSVVVLQQGTLHLAPRPLQMVHRLGRPRQPLQHLLMLLELLLRRLLDQLLLIHLVAVLDLEPALLGGLEEGARFLVLPRLELPLHLLELAAAALGLDAGLLGLLVQASLGGGGRDGVDREGEIAG